MYTSLCTNLFTPLLNNPASLLYVQALKFLQTKAMPGAARKASRERRVRRATGRKS